MLVNGVLSYIKAFRQRVDVQPIKVSILDRYDVSVRSAKNELWNACKEDLKRLKLEYNRRRGTASRSQANADFDDIVIALDALDGENLLPQVFYSSEDLLFLPAPLPHRGPEELVSVLKSMRTELMSKMENLDRSVQSMARSVNSAPAVKPAASVNVSGSMQRPGIVRNEVDVLERRSNIVIFGISEDKSLLETRETVDGVLSCAAGKSVQVRDMFRLGKKKQSEVMSTSSERPRPRPVLVKLQCAWDRCILLAGKWKLFDSCDYKSIFIHPDMSIEERNKLKHRLAEQRRQCQARDEVCCDLTAGAVECIDSQ